MLAVLSTNDLLTGLGLVIVLAIGSQLLAARLRIPALVLLLTAGFVAGAVTDDVHPANLFGATFQPLVSLAVGLILFEAGLHLRFGDPSDRGVVSRLVAIGVPLTLAGTALAAKLIFGLNWGVSVLIGAILVVSGPTVVQPLLAFVRPTQRVRSVLKWEATLIDPAGALLSVAAFTAVRAGAGGQKPFHLGELALSFGVGLAAAVIATAVLWMLLPSMQRTNPSQAIPAVLMCVAAALVGADLLREDAGFFAALGMGLFLANQRRLDISPVLEFLSTIVSLLIGLLFILISASVTPSQVSGVLPETVVLIAVMVLLLRPLNVALAARRSRLTWRERAFVAWMAPRGIVAAATASSFGLELTQARVAGADKILPIAFVVIFATVVLYGLSAVPVGRLLGIAGAEAPVVLVVGGHPWARSMAQSLKAAGVRVRIWTDDQAEQEAARAAGLDARHAPLWIDLDAREAELEEVSTVLVMTESDAFNGSAAYELRQELGSLRVFRLAARSGSLDSVPTHAQPGILFADDLNYAELTRRFEAGARIEELPDNVRGRDSIPLFALSPDGNLKVMTANRPTGLDAEERAICLSGP